MVGPVGPCFVVFYDRQKRIFSFYLKKLVVCLPEISEMSIQSHLNIEPTNVENL
jgi:hypothetical protein